MSESGSIVLELQADAIQQEIYVAGLLRKAKVAATKLGQDDAIEWIDAELNGYDCAYDDLPKYRRLHGRLKAWNPFNGMIPVIIEDAESEELLTRSPIFDGVGSLQSTLNKSSEGGTLHFSLNGVHRQTIMNMFDVQMEPKLIISTSQIENILQQVVSMVLDWSLELEKAGVLGEGLSFTIEEKSKAEIVTQQIIATSIGHVGNNSEKARTSIEQTTNLISVPNSDALAQFLSEARRALPLLDSSVAENVQRDLDTIEQAETPERRNEAFVSLRSVLEGAGGGVAAQGILSLLANLLG